jgi:hypothetical protein
VGPIHRLVGVLALAVVTILVGASPAQACTLGIPTISADRTVVAAGGTVHLTGGAPFYEIVPVEERPPTTTTTLEGGGAIADCPPVRPASSFDVSLSRFNPASQRIVGEVILHVERDTLDHDVVIPASTAPGEVTLSATNAGSVTITVTRGGDLPATGSPLWSYTALAMLLLSMGSWFLGARWLRHLP